MSAPSHNQDAGRGYSGIAAALREQIVRGDLGPGEQLPSISELAARHQTTQVTVRRALRALEEEGLIRVEHGVGTFVAEWDARLDLLHLPGFAAEMEARELPSETVVRERAEGVRHAEAAEALGLPPNARLIMLARLRKVRGVAVAFQRSYLSTELLQVVRGYAEGESLYGLLARRSGQIPVAARERVRIEALPPEVAGELEKPRGSPGWRTARITSDAAGRPLVYDEAFYPADRLELRVERRSGRASVTYEIVSGTEATR